MKKLLDFQASISDVKQVNPLFSTCKVRVLYTGRNRNMSIITKDSVEKALPTLKNIPIVGEFSEENKDYKGHGGAVSMDDYRFIHTTKPYGVVPESATYEWEEVKGRDGSTREYLTIHGCYLWTGRYEEAFSIVEKGKGQSMEIEVTDGRWDDDQDAYQIDNFIFSALCILGDEVEPAFEDANITAYSLDKDSFKKEFSTMLSELKSSLPNEKEVNDMLKELLKKYSLTVEDLTAKGIDFNEISEDELEAKIIEAFEIKPEDDAGDKGDDKEPSQDEPKDEPIQEENPIVDEPVVQDGVKPEVVVEDENQIKPDIKPEVVVEDKDQIKPDIKETVTEDKGAEPEGDDQINENPSKDEPKVDTDFEALKGQIAQLQAENDALTKDVEELREFKLNVEKAEHESKAQKLFSDFQLTTEDVATLDVHAFSIEEIEEKCFAILGRKMASKKNFSKSKEEGNIRINVGEDNLDNEPKTYGGLLSKFNKNKK